MLIFIRVNPQVSQYGSLYQDIGTGNKESNLQGLFQSEESSSIPGHLPVNSKNNCNKVHDIYLCRTADVELLRLAR